jgi:uncharacterized membrane protein
MQNLPPNQGYGDTLNQSEKSSTGLEPNIAALLAYTFWLITGLVFYVIEKENRFVRFHAMQAILLGISAFVISFGFSIFNLVISQVSGILSLLIGFPLSMLLFVGFIGLWIYCMLKAYQGVKFKLPVIGNMAENMVSK